MQNSKRKCRKQAKVCLTLGHQKSLIFLDGFREPSHPEAPDDQQKPSRIKENDVRNTMQCS
eukprot:m.308986 g.308986  ORF g.308986 m.308986 type:complete len:61 (+) comp45228_c0_seq1:535-717(+)